MKINKVYCLLVAVAIVSCFTACDEKPKEEKIKQPSVDTVKPTITPEAPKAQVPDFDRSYDELASYIAGVQGRDSSSQTLVKDSIWLQYAKLMDQSWDKANRRHSVLKQWSDSEAVAAASKDKVLFYPFSGPDFLNANILFPNCNKYILAGLEPVGQLPDFSMFEAGQRYGYLEGIGVALKDILHSSFFHTKRMKVQFKAENVNGALPIICIFLKRTGFEIMNIEAVKLDTAGTVQTFAYDSLKSEKFKPNGTQITFLDPKTLVQKQLLFFSQDLSNGGLGSKVPFTKYLNNLSGYFCFMKSASYLTHYDYFSTIRNAVLNNAVGLLQDDTGIPYRFFEEDKWNITLYGGYKKPVDTFKKAIFTQKDLQARFKTDSVNIEALPFSLGYQRNPKHTSIIFALKK
jgi:hypothetical protein